MRKGIAVVLTACLTLAAAIAWGYWTTGSTAGGNGAAAATSVNQGATPTASAVGSTVTVTWTASTLANGTAVSGYLVKRYDAVTSVQQTILSNCTGTITALTCNENAVPNGSWKYTVTPVLASFWQGPVSAYSSTVVVVALDTTPPVNAITLSGITGGAAKTGNTVYYRGVAAGSFTLTNAVSDGGSGPASSATAALGGTTTGWTHTPSTVSTPSGGPYVSSAFNWAAATTSSPTEAVTGRDVANNTTPTTLTFVNDSTAPGAGTVTYPDGYQTSLSVPVTFTTGTDGGSGIVTRQLQRATAPLTTTGTCVTWSGFADVGPNNPTSVYTDSQVDNGVCYQYRYVVTDGVGNQHIATSANVAKVDYAGAVNGTTGLLSHWRLGEGAATLISSDSFTGTAATLLTARSGEIGATWEYQGGSANTEQISSENRARRNGTGYSINNTTATPPTADYSVEADLFVKSNLAGEMAGVIGRLNKGANTFYMARWEQPDTSWNLVKYTNGTITYPAYVAGQLALAIGETYRVRLDMTGTALKLYVNGVLTVSATDSTFTAAGKAGIMDGNSGATASKNDDAGLHFENFQVTPSTYPRAADSKGSNTGDYKNGVTLAATGALPADTNTAAQFDGVNDYVQVTNSTGIPTGAGLRSVEMWFKTTSAARQVLFQYGTRANTQEFGLWLDAGGTTMTAWGFGNGNDKVFTPPSAANNGAWHQVVQTYNGTSLTLYIDGVALPSQAATRGTVMDSYGFGIGAVINPSDANSGGFFTGALDEVSFYTTVLTQQIVTNHYQLGSSASADTTGPTGGSVDASGLVGTGSRYAASTTLSLDLAKGTDPSGVATTGNLLKRATATLTSSGTANGTCGSFGSYTTVTGGTDPTTPKSDIVADQACYSYQYVVLDTLGNPTTYTSPDIKVDLTAPAAPSLAHSAFTNTYWSSGAVVYYRSAASTGAFTTTSTATDTKSGIASHTFPTLGTNWTSTPGALGVNTYSWSGAPQVPGAKNITATNHAGVPSGNTSFTPTADDTAPSAGTVTPPNTTQASTSVSVAYTTGTDGGSGLSTRLLQRQSATLTGTTCGSYGGWTTASSNPASSPFGDTVTAGFCYKYQYVVSDRVGNQHTATSANVVKVTSAAAYFDSVNGTTGLLSYWRLGEATTSSDTFTGSTGTELSTHTGEIGAAWTLWQSATPRGLITNEGRLRRNVSGGVGYYSSATPASPDYLVEADVNVKSVAATDDIGINGRIDLSDTGAIGTNYLLRYHKDATLAQWELRRNLVGVGTALAVFPQTLTPGSTYRVGLDMNGTTIRMLVDGVERGSVSDATIAGAGRSGVRLGASSSDAPQSDTQGMHLDNFTVSPPLADSDGTNNGDYLGGPTLGIGGAITGDSNAAAQFDGINDFGTVARQISDDFTIEFWFKSTQGIGTGSGWWAGAGLVDAEVSGSANDFGVSLRSDGKILAGVGPTDITIVSTLGGYDDGSWHHVVFTRTMSSGALLLYVDGGAAGSATGSTASLTAPANINFGRIQSGTNYYLGALDEIAIYNTVISPATVTAHFNAAQ